MTCKRQFNQTVSISFTGDIFLIVQDDKYFVFGIFSSNPPLLNGQKGSEKPRLEHIIKCLTIAFFFFWSIQKFTEQLRDTKILKHGQR